MNDAFRRVVDFSEISGLTAGDGGLNSIHAMREAMNSILPITWTRRIIALFSITAVSCLAESPLPHGDARSSLNATPILLVPEDRVILQRGFVAFNNELKVYACAVGTPEGMHFAYDFDTGSLLSIWRGPFADLSEMWGNRAFNQNIRPIGSQVLLSAKPAIALFPEGIVSFPMTWPEQSSPLYVSKGYELEPNGQPVFLAQFEGLIVRDRISPTLDARGLKRQIEFSGKLSPWQTWFLLVEADSIIAEPDGSGWRSGKKDWAIEWPLDSPLRPEVWETQGRELLIIRISKDVFPEQIVYSLVW